MSTKRMTPEQARVAELSLCEEEASRTHLVVHLSGAHAYGFPSHDSDLDLKAIHIVPTARLLSFQKDPMVSNRLEIVQGVEVDYTSNELRKALAGLIKGDGNMLERVMSHDPMRAHEALESLRPLARDCISRSYHRHYVGFAHSQAEALKQAEAPSAKKSCTSCGPR